MESKFNVVFTGEFKPGIERGAFIQAFSQRFQCDETKSARLFDSATKAVMKSAVAQDVAENYRDVLDALGMVIELEAVPSAEPQAADNNPYQAPKAKLQDAQQFGEMSGPVSVPIGHGWSWISTAYSNHIKGNLLAWIGAIAIYAVLSIGIQFLPFIGMVLASLFGPVFGAGFMLGAKAQDDGEAFTVGHVFSGFKQSTGQLVMVGVFYLIGMIAIFAIPAILMGGSFAMLGMVQAGDPAAAEAMAQNPAAILVPMLVMMLLLIPLMMAYWFAPALVAIDGIPALTAMKLSFSGCLKNMLPFLLYGIAATVLMFLASIPLFLGLFVLMPVLTASIYTAYRDIYFPGA